MLTTSEPLEAGETITLVFQYHDKSVSRIHSIPVVEKE
jgi:hypothetical protein